MNVRPRHPGARCLSVAMAVTGAGTLCARAAPELAVAACPLWRGGGVGSCGFGCLSAVLLMGGLAAALCWSIVQLKKARAECRLMARRLDGSPRDTRGAEVVTTDTASEHMTTHKKGEQQERRFMDHVQHGEKLKSLEIMAGGIAHDFNNLFVGVLGNAELALTDLSPLSPARASLEAIKEAAIEASELTSQLLAYAGKGHLRVELTDLNELIKNIDQLLRISVGNRVSLQYHLASEPVPVEIDVAQVRQLIVSLVTNAAEAIGQEGGAVDVYTSVKDVSSAELAATYLDDNLPPGRYACLEIHDTGCGMSIGQTALIFDPFFTTKSSGKGLGLASVLGVVRRHHGAVRVESTLGQGTSFTVLLPASDKVLRSHNHNNGGGAHQLTACETPEALGCTVLVIDDQERVRDVLEAMLMRRGCTVYTAGDGETGIAHFRSYHDDIDLIILNMTMPGLSSAATLKELVRIDPSVKVILCTGYPEEEARKKFAGQQLAGFIHKPFKMDDMLALVSQVLKG